MFGRQENLGVTFNKVVKEWVEVMSCFEEIKLLVLVLSGHEASVELSSVSRDKLCGQLGNVKLDCRNMRDREAE